jgi:hypothetical protein
MQRFVVLVFSAIFAAGVVVSAPPALAKTKGGITPLSVCSSKGEWDKLNKTLRTRAHAYNIEFLGRIDKSNPNRQDKHAAARSALASTKKGQPVDVNCRPLPGGTVHVDDVGGFSGYMCVRAPKWKSCGWIHKRYFTDYFGATSDPRVWRRNPQQEILFFYR